MAAASGGVGGAGSSWLPQSRIQIQVDPLELERARIREYRERHQINPDLESLHLGATKWDKDNISVPDIEYISRTCLKLTSLRLENLQYVTTIATGLFSTSTLDFPSLTFLHVSNCPKLEKFRIGALLLERLEIFDNPLLRSIQARVQFSAKILVRSPFPQMEIERISLEDSDLKRIRAPSGESLDLSYCEEISDEGLKPLMKLPLKKLSLRGCQKLTSKEITILSDSLSPVLKEIDLGEMVELPEHVRAIFGPSDDTLNLYWGIRTVEHVDLSDNPRLSDSYFDHNASSFGLTIGFGEKALPSKLEEPLDDEFRIPLQGYPRWLSLSISNCSNLTSRAFTYIGNLEFLRELRANHLPLLTDEGLNSLKQNSLVKLSIAKCKQITDAGLKALEAIKTLRMLNVKGCPQVTLRGVLSLTKAMPGVQILHDLDSTVFKKE